MSEYHLVTVKVQGVETYVGNDPKYGQDLMNMLREEGEQVTMDCVPMSKMTCSKDDILDFIQTEMEKSGECHIRVGEAHWVVTK